MESHILEDVNKCIIALRDEDADNLDRAAGAIRGRAARVAHIVTGEMDSYEPGAYTEGVMRNVNLLTSTAIPEFVTQVNVALEALSKNSLDVFDDDQFVDISKKIYDTIHDIRCSVMMIRVTRFLFKDDDDCRIVPRDFLIVCINCRVVDERSLRMEFVELAEVYSMYVILRYQTLGVRASEKSQNYPQI
ncbi:hypothetical protein PANDA_017471 [Ailuropoda melanoleuca]|uniref:Uncharacterized protein n=1 Tax=Ailuropoda melanoleuca TaxID=9646 RepID=D2HXT5_AILME|nr:hypothetical protein PANDA_017471 [Ailuropoda melanoleuca]